MCPINSYLTKIFRLRYNDRQNSVVQEMIVVYSENRMTQITMLCWKTKGFL